MNLRLFGGIAVCLAIVAGLATWWVIDDPTMEQSEVVEITAYSKPVEEEPDRLNELRPQEESMVASLDSWIYDEDDPEDYFSVATATRFLNYPQTPYEVYANNFDSAEAGDPASMYRISKAFLECQKAPRNREQFEKYYLSNPALQPFWTQFENAMERCQTFSDLIKEDVAYALQARYWRDRAAEEGYLTARAEWLLDEIENPIDTDPLHDELNSVIELATQTEGYPAYYQMAGYLERLEAVNNEAVESVYDRNRPDAASAWRYAGCKLQEGCNQDKFFILMKKNWHQYETDEFLERVYVIETQMAGGGSETYLY